MTRAKNLLTYLGFALVAGCSSDPGELDLGCEDGTCDVDAPDSEIDPHPCDRALIDRSGRDVEHTVNRLNDPFVEKVFKAEASGTSMSPCPTDFEQVIAKLQETDNEGCNIQTFVVSEEGAILDKDEDPGAIGYRAVTTRSCDGRDKSDFVFSAFGFNNAGGNPMDINESGLPGDVEVMAFDETAGVFNYYKAIGIGGGEQAFFFFGNSKDYIDKSPGGPGLTDVRGCGNCHGSGGLIMKELDSPWVNWHESGDDISGARQLVENRADAMGSFSAAFALETQVVEPGNAKWNDSKIAHLQARGQLSELLRPLFCPTDFNIQTGSKTKVEDTFLFDPILAGDFQFDAKATAEADNPLGGFSSLESNDYDNIIIAMEQDNQGISNDLDKAFSYVERSHADGNYVSKLVSAGIIDEQLMTDVLMVDFTRPLHSNARCGIVASLEEVVIAPEDQNPEGVRSALLTALEGASEGSPEAQLVAYLEASASGTPADHQATLDTYTAACEARTSDNREIDILLDGEPATTVEVPALQHDIMKLRSLQRKLVFGHDGVLDLGDIVAVTAGAAQAMEDGGFEALFAMLRNVAFKPASVFEFDGALPTDSLQVVEGATESFEIEPDAHLDPITCQLTTGFVSVPVTPVAPSDE